MEREAEKQPFGKLTERWSEAGVDEIDAGNVLMLRHSQDDISRLRCGAG